MYLLPLPGIKEYKVSMKTTVFSVILILCCWFGSLRAQTGIITIPPPGPPTVGDTITAGTQICLDTTVTSFIASFSYNGRMVEKHCVGNCFHIPKDLKSGTKIFCEQIISEPRPGQKKKLPVRTFHVR